MNTRKTITCAKKTSRPETHRGCANNQNGHRPDTSLDLKLDLKLDLRLILITLITLVLLIGLASKPVLAANTAEEALYLSIGNAQLITLPAAADNVFVANPDIADVQVKSPRLIYLYGRTAGETTIFAVNKKDQVLLNKRIVVGANLHHLNQTLSTLFPASTVKASMVNKSLMLSGDVSRASDADQIRRLALQYVSDEKLLFDRTRLISPNQVNLQVRVAEVSREVTKRIGFNWNISDVIGGLAIGLVTANPAAAAIPNALSLSRTNGSFSLDATIDALEENGLITILAEPNLTALSGEEATFLAGGEFPILVPSGNGDVTVEFKEYGVSLSFTPTVMDRNRISLQVAPEVSQLSQAGAVEVSGYSIPSLTTRRTSTRVELGSGQSMAIAGFLRRGSQQDLDKLPGIGDLPVLGALFNSDSFQREETELVIMVTPYVVQPVDSQRIALPTDRFQMPRDADRIAHATQWQDNAQPPKPSANPESIQTGRLGLRLDSNFAPSAQPAVLTTSLPLPLPIPARFDSRPDLIRPDVARREDASASPRPGEVPPPPPSNPFGFEF